MASQKIPRRTFLKKSLTTTAAVIMATISSCTEKEIPDWFELSQWDVIVTGLGASFDGFRILHLTDIHYSEWMDASRLAALKKFVLDTPVELIVVTGDSSYHTEDFADLIDFYTGLGKHAPVVMTWGNHDIWDDTPNRLLPFIHDQVILLSNDHLALQRGDDQLVIAGLNCAYEELDDIAAVVDRLPAGIPAIMLAHEPDIAKNVAATGAFFFQLSGHSHGGQICLPNGYAPMLPWLGQQYPRGYYDVDGMMLYTSRGLGRGKPFLRTFCPAEAEIFTLRSGNQMKFKETQGKSNQE
ncbi:MAG: metallophosphoesterase [Anaerolineae bacterium]|jgi:predicted MPP superfamily phosphohydrolase|nr:metallophosphoesterase [Anaerolineae bacterium]